MPTYVYKCQKCDKQFDKFLPLKEYKTPQPCPACSGESIKIMAIGGIQDDSPVWLDQSIRNQLQDTDSPHIPITTRKQYEKHLKENGIIPSR